MTAHQHSQCPSSSPSHSPNPSFIPNGHPDQPLFQLGTLVATPGALAMLKELGLAPIDFVIRHRQGDWGNLDEDDIKANRAALHYGTRLLSSYGLGNGRALWIITEWDRSSTTLLLPEEY